MCLHCAFLFLLFLYSLRNFGSGTERDNESESDRLTGGLTIVETVKQALEP